MFTSPGPLILLRALIIEDCPADAKLMLHELRQAGFAPDWQRVETESDFLARLDPAPDIILADYSLPGFDAMRALRLLQERGLNIPFIVVTGAIGDEAAAECVKQGAIDHLLKDRLARLGQAVARALEQKRLHEEKQRAEAALRESEERYRRLVELSPEAIMVHREGKLVFANTAGVRLLGAETPAEVLGTPILDLVHPDYREAARQRMNQIREQGITAIEKDNRAENFCSLCYSLPPLEGKFLRLDGAEVEVEVMAVPFTYQDQPAIQVVARDISARKRAEQERAQLLAREREARREAEQANRAKDEFLMTLSHELRTPLNSTLGWIRLLRTMEIDAATAALGLETIERNARLQAQLIEELLDVSRIIAGKLSLDLRTVELGAVIQAAIDAVRPAAEAKAIRLETALESGAGLVSGDPNRLQQVVWNLLSNAVKFTPSGGRVEVRLARAGAHGEKCPIPFAQLTVSDTGRGISAEFLPHVFERFRQADASTTRASGGLGLGLAIVQRLVELHGGAVRAESQGEGKGATFTVTLPLPKDEGRKVREEANVIHPSSFIPHPSLVGLRVLIVDDDLDTCRMLTVALARRGAEVRACTSTAEALEAFQRWRPDVLVSDLGMPDEDGYALIRQVRAMAPRRGRLVPAVALTAYARTEDRRQALAAGFQVHLSKPIDPAILASAVASLSAGGSHA